MPEELINSVTPHEPPDSADDASNAAASRRRRGPGDRSDISNALRHLGRQEHGTLAELLQGAIEWPDEDHAHALEPLIRHTAVLVAWEPWERAEALAAVIREGIQYREVAPTANSRRRRALQAGFRLTDRDVREPWGRSLNDRFRQLRDRAKAV